MSGPSASIDDAADLIDAIRQIGLAERDETPCCTPLSGGVSSAIWRIDLRDGPVCAKRALAKLNVASEWFAPTERNFYEVAWFNTVAEFIPHVVPRILGIDTTRRLFVMEFFDPATHPVWKAELRAGRANQSFAATVGRVLAHIHASTADRDDLAAAFSTDEIFWAIRLDPYFRSTAQRHPDLKEALDVLARTTAISKRALVHGDISPKNILVGPQGPIFLDAECAWYGDPAFDLAFCLTHLLLKCLWIPSAARLFLACFESMEDAYLMGVTWESREAIESRAAALLPALLLARVDGKSPVDYLADDSDRNCVRRIARACILAPTDRLAAVRDAWTQELGLA